MSQRLHYSQHALQRLDERGILRRWIEAVVGTRPSVYGRDEVFTLSSAQLGTRFGLDFRLGLRVVVDGVRHRIVTAHWVDGSAA